VSYLPVKNTMGINMCHIYLLTKTMGIHMCYKKTKIKRMTQKGKKKLDKYKKRKEKKLLPQYIIT
jgi:hypothetical protein